MIVKKVEKYPNKRLAFYDRHANNTFWDGQWKQLRVEDLLNNTLLKLLRANLPTKGKLIETGCGLSQYVKILADMGYDVQGIDFSRLAIRKAKKFDKKLSLVIGDVLSLPYLACSFNGCFSLGVVEHFEDGPEDAIRELHRILVEGGILLISVPFFNPLRQIKGYLGLYNNNKGTGLFYQYAFTIDEFTRILQKLGFVILSISFYNVLQLLSSEIPFLRKLNNLLRRKNQKTTNNIKNHKISRISAASLILKIVNFKIMRRFLGHMMVFVAKKA